MDFRARRTNMADQFDLIIRNAAIYDGSGAAPFADDVAIRDDRIAAVGAVTGAGREIDARGLAIAPGFIDVHSHDDFIVFIEPEMDFKVMQGVTTDVVGNCGLGAAPYAAAHAVFRAFHSDPKVPAWEGYRGYFQALDRDPPSLNVAVLAGHGSIRLSAMGNAKRAPSGDELAAMRRAIREAIDAGAVGLSTGLVYEPGRYAQTEEIIELAREMADSGALYASHMRNEAAAPRLGARDDPDRRGSGSAGADLPSQGFGSEELGTGTRLAEAYRAGPRPEPGRYRRPISVHFREHFACRSAPE